MRHSTVRILAFVFVLVNIIFYLKEGVIMSADLNEIAWREDFEKVNSWVAQPGWLGNPSTTAKLTADGKVACFSVDEPRKGMKWSRSIPQIWLPQMRFLLLRYKAENLQTDMTQYLVYVDDNGGKHECHAFRLGDAVSDGKWRTIAVDTLTLTSSDTASGLAIQVQASSKGNARIMIDWLAFSDRLPEGVKEIHRGGRAPAAKDWMADLKSAKWVHHNDWLPNPAKLYQARREGPFTLFQVGEPSQGMKWSWDPPKKIELSGYRYVAMRYRARGAKPSGDYTLCVIGKPRGDGLDYTAVISPSDLISDGRWHTVSVDITQAARQFARVGALAVQVQAGRQTPAELLVERISFTNEVQPSVLSDLIDYAPGGKSAGFRMIDISALCNDDARRVLRCLRIKGWPEESAINVHGVPFALRQNAPNVYSSSIRGEEDLAVPVDAAASEVFLFLFGTFVGKEEPTKGTGKFRVIRGVDRFRLALEYDDGQKTECLPLNVSTKRFEVAAGAQVLWAFAEPSKRLRKITVRDISSQAAFAIAAVTCRTTSERLWAEFVEDLPPLRVRKTTRTIKDRPPLIEHKDNSITLSNKYFSATLELKPAPVITSMVNSASKDDYLDGQDALPLFNLSVNGKEIGPDALRLASPPFVENDGEAKSAALRYAPSDFPGVIVKLNLAAADSPELEINFSVENRGNESVEISFSAPRLRRFRLGKNIADNYYLFPKRGAAFDNQNAILRGRYCGLFPVQFVSTFNPASDSGLYLRTEDLESVMHSYVLAKTDDGMTVSVEYPSLKLSPGETRSSVKTLIGISDGDWHTGFNAYREWLKTWYKPAAPRQQWFREVFNFRQRFLHWLDPLYDHKSGEFHLQRAVVEGREKFGGIDYLHIFDWGNCGKYGRIYGRTGDYSPYDYIKGGMEALKRAIADIQAQGIPVGLYIEGYLLQEKGKLGQAHGKEWQLIRKGGDRAYWPKSSEMYACSWVDEWREVQASTYATKVKELNVSGMYLDEYGFSGPWVDCYSDAHGHVVPGFAVVGERGCTKMVRERINGVKSGVALYSEEIPCDVTSQYEDGSFTYAMSQAQHTATQAPMNVFRFAVPSFKTFEILYCDKPTGAWATGVKWVFFNGEGIWLEGPADEWFAPKTLTTIRKCHAILRKHKDAFTTDEPVPLVQTEMGGVFANLFPIKGKSIYTLYNSLHRTASGEMLRVPRSKGARYWDEWSGKELPPRKDGDYDLLSLSIGPRGVGCVVCEYDASGNED